MTDLTPPMAAAIRHGCQAADIHIRCSFPDCICTTVPVAVKAGVSFALRQALGDMAREIKSGVGKAVIP